MALANLKSAYSFETNQNTPMDFYTNNDSGRSIRSDTPRGGILLSTSRAAKDVARISKFFLSPKGLIFNATQIGLQLSNPNVEGVSGTPAKIINPNSTKIYSPGNILANVAGAHLGIRTKRHGIAPISIIGFPSGYEETLTTYRQFKIANNRLVRLGNELGIFNTIKDQIQPIDVGGVSLGAVGQAINKGVNKLRDKLGFKGQVINTLTSITGPKSVAGIGRTTITRSVNSIDEQLKFNNNGKENTRLDRNENTKILKGVQDRFKQFNGLRGLVEEPDFDGVGTKPLKETDTAEKAKNTNNLPVGDIKAYKTLAYGNIPKRDTSRKHLDFRTGQEYDRAKIPLSKFVDTSKDKLIDDISGIGNNLDHSEDLIKFSVSNTSLGETARLLCYLTSFSDQLGQDVELVDVSGFGDEEEGATQSPITRAVAISIIVAARNPKELAYIYDTLDKLRYITSVANFASERSKLTLGNLFNNLDCYLISINTSWDTEFAFDMDNKVPYVLEIDMDFTIPEVSLNYDFEYRG